MSTSNSKITTAIIQARLGSSRFPGKMLKELSGKPLIYWVLERVKRASTLDNIILATSDKTKDGPLAEYAKSLNVVVFRGDEDDVLGRFCGAIKNIETNTVVRICADNPLVDPEIIDYAVSAFNSGKYDYMYNHIPKNGCEYPDGLGVEVLNRDVLYELNDVAENSGHREHVTSYIWDNQEKFTISPVDCPSYWNAKNQPIKLDIDRQEDLEDMNALCSGLNVHSSGKDIIEHWRKIHNIRN